MNRIGHGKLAKPPLVLVAIHYSNAGYPAVLKALLGKRAPESIQTIGNQEILREKKLALFCSIKCPGGIILKTYDLARHLRDTGVTVISGFHAPMEKECLRILLRGRQSLIICPARSLHGMRIPREWRAALAQGRLLLLSPFDRKHHRITARLAVLRNEFVAALAGRVFIAHAAPGGKTETFCRIVLTWKKPLLTFKGPENAILLALEARPYEGAASLTTGES